MSNRSTRNLQVHLARRPDGAASEQDFRIAEAEVETPQDGDVLVRNLFLSVDPYMRGRMGGGVSYASGFALGHPIPARVVGEVAQSRNPSFAPGDFVWGFLAWEEFTRVRAGAGLRKVDKELGPLSHAISVRGMPGLTAEVGMIDLGRPHPGDTVFVSAATGAVGSVAGQLAKRAGCRVVGSAGSANKVQHALTELGFDAAFNYKEEPVAEALTRLCPEGIDVYFDNVGGETLDAALAQLNTFARVPVCGQISQYDGNKTPLHNIAGVLHTRSWMGGFVIYDHMHKFDTFVPRMAGLIDRGDIRYFEDIVDGIENAPAAFVGMMTGDNLGKRLVRVRHD
jgi:NADPH-dependent curcumin reductase CurA